MQKKQQPDNQHHPQWLMLLNFIKNEEKENVANEHDW